MVEDPSSIRRDRHAGAEVREDLVDDRRLRDAGDDAHRAVAGGTREGVHLEDLLQEGRPSAGGVFVPVPDRLAPPVTHGWGRTPVQATVGSKDDRDTVRVKLVFSSL